jgi:hypothetical protein
MRKSVWRRAIFTRFRVSGFGFRRFRVSEVSGFGFRVSGFGFRKFRVSGSGGFESSEFRVSEVSSLGRVRLDVFDAFYI